MPIPTRSRSLRQPGYANREIIESIQKRNADLKSTSSQRKDDNATPQGSSGSTTAISKGVHGDNSTRLQEDQGAPEGLTEHYVETQSFVQCNAGPAAITSAVALSGHRPSADARDGASIKPTSVTDRFPGPGRLNSSGQPTRLTQLRQPRNSSKDVKPRDKDHTRPTSVIETSTSNTRGHITSTPSASPLRQSSLASQAVPPPGTREPSVSSGIVVNHRRSKSSNTLLERESIKLLPSARDRPGSIARPQFSTYQQHFSPKKQTPQIATANIPESPSTVANSELACFRALQDELLQLQLLYLPSGRTLEAWRESGQTNISQRQRRHNQEVAQLRAMGQHQQDCINAAALQDWQSGNGGTRSSTKVEALSQCVQLLTDLIRPHERFSGVVVQFEVWYKRTKSILEERCAGSLGLDVRFIEPLPQTWADALPALTRYFEQCTEGLNALGSASNSSGLALVLEGHKRLARNLLNEVHAMMGIHASVIQMEDDWIKQRVSEMVDTKEVRSTSHGSPRCAAWETMP
jgi:hypothetical protein